MYVVVILFSCMYLTISEADQCFYFQKVIFLHNYVLATFEYNNIPTDTKKAF